MRQLLLRTYSCCSRLTLLIPVAVTFPARLVDVDSRTFAPLFAVAVAFPCCATFSGWTHSRLRRGYCVTLLPRLFGSWVTRLLPGHVAVGCRILRITHLPPTDHGSHVVIAFGQYVALPSRYTFTITLDVTVRLPHTRLFYIQFTPRCTLPLRLRAPALFTSFTTGSFARYAYRPTVTTHCPYPGSRFPHGGPQLLALPLLLFR